MTRRTRLEVTRFEDRVNPVLGGADVPFAADVDDPIGPTTVDLSGVVDYNGTATGVLLDRGAVVVGSRHILTTASAAPAVGQLVTFTRRLSDGNLQRVSIPVESVWIEPTYPGTPNALVGDVALVTLAAVAPFGATDYQLYTAAQAAVSPEVGRVYYLNGYGPSGTGLSGLANGFELQRMTITATGGSFRIVNPGTGAVSSLVTPNYSTPAATANTLTQLNNAFNSIMLAAQVTRVTTGPFAPAGSVNNYEVRFNLGGNVPRLQFQTEPGAELADGGNAGSVRFATLLNGAIDPEYQRVRVTATAGTFRLGFSGVFTNPIPFNATAAGIQAALEAIPQIGEATVRAVTAGANAGTFEVSFDTIGFDVPQLTADVTALTGSVAVATIADGGTRALRVGQNTIDGVSASQGTLRSDFSNNGTDSFEGLGNAGAPGFIDLGGGQVGLVSLGSAATGSVFTSDGFNTRLSKYSTNILNQAAGIRIVANVPIQDTSAVTLDMQYQFAGGDGTPDTITVQQATVGNTPVIQVFVASGAQGKQLYYQDILAGISSVRLVGTADDDTFVVDANLAKLVVIDGGFGQDTVIGPAVATAWNLTGAGAGIGDAPAFDFTFQNIEAIRGGAADDTFRFTNAGSLAGALDGGGGTDLLDYSQRAVSGVILTGTGSGDGFAGVATAVGGGFNNINGYVANPVGTGDTLIGADLPGTFTHALTANLDADGGTYTVPAGNLFLYANVDTLAGGADNDTFNVRSTFAALTIDGGAGDDTVNAAADAPLNLADGGALGGTLTVRGGAGTDSLRFNGSAANEDVVARVSGDGNGDLSGLPTSVVYLTMERVLFDGRGGLNSFAAHDITNASLGTPTDPASGFAYYPFSATGGYARLYGVAVGGTAINNGFTVNGDPDGSGDRDVLLVLGTSSPGFQSPFGEAEVGDGRDRIVVSEAAVTFQSVTGGTLLPVQIGYTNGVQTFSTLYVAGGNEAGNEGDTITVPTTLTFNLVVDGMLPSPAARPGDRVVVVAPGGADAALVTDPSAGPTQTRVTARFDGSSAGLVGFESGVPAVPGAGMIAVGTDAGTPSTVRVFDRATGAFRYEVTPFENFSDGVKVASGDVNGDGVADLVVGAGPGGGPRVAVFNGLDGSLLYDFFGYEESFRGGVTVAVGDLDQDGFGDIILGTGVDGGPRVVVYSGRNLSVIRDVFVFEASFRGGVSVAVGDVNGDGIPDLITSAGKGGGPRVVVRDGSNLAELASFFVFDPNSRDGFMAAGGDVNGDGFADIIAGSGAGAQNQIRVFSGFNRALLNDFFVNDPFEPGRRSSSSTAGVRVAVADVNVDGVGDIVTGLGPGGDGVVRVYQTTGVNPQTNALFATLQEIRRQDAFDVGFGFGVYVGASD